MNTKDFSAKVKAVGEEGSGQVKAIVAAYNVDSTSERIAPGSFQKSLDSWKASGRQVPVVWAHQHQDIWAHIGTTTDMQETSDGLVADMQLDMENPTAKQAYKLIKSGRIQNYSFAYDVIDSEYDEKDGVLNLKELNILEAGPCLIGANRATGTLAVKSDEVETKAGRTLSSANAAKIKNALQSIQDALESLEAVLGVNDSDDAASGDEGKAQEGQLEKVDEEPEAKAEADEPEVKSADEPVRSVPVRAIEAELELM
jgi:Escherichia/Staphylococcus phage prohead protease